MDVERKAGSMQLVHSPNVWFDDGTVVLQAETTLFRVYRGVLIAQSPIFSDTFAIPQPSALDVYQGCPLIELHDSARDLELFLMATHHAGYFVNSPIDGFDTLSSLLRLATKYEVEHIRTRMISILTAIYPSLFTAWLSRAPPAGYTEYNNDDFKALSLASDLRILSVLPGVYYECCRYPVGTIVDCLSDGKARQKCIAAIATFTNDLCRDIHSFLFCGPDTCEREAACSELRLNWIMKNGLPKFDEIFDPFQWDTIHFCGPCALSGKQVFEMRRKRLWQDLPSLFDLPPWEDLLKVQ
ncbi:hypothetical protein B0H11DRAFT_1340731 [Mycena galericulata]|nr:hypothetical protein B0H11DRAFT_1340731 [Mycena galericulata]